MPHDAIRALRGEWPDAPMACRIGTRLPSARPTKASSPWADPATPANSARRQTPSAYGREPGYPKAAPSAANSTPGHSPMNGDWPAWRATPFWPWPCPHPERLHHTGTCRRGRVPDGRRFRRCVPRHPRLRGSRYPEISGTAFSFVLVMAVARGSTLPYATGVLGQALGLRPSLLIARGDGPDRGDAEWHDVGVVTGSAEAFQDKRPPFRSSISPVRLLPPIRCRNARQPRVLILSQPQFVARRSPPGDEDANRRPHTPLTVGAHLTAPAFDEPSHDGQAEAGARGAGGEMGLEDLG
jgi:hypothetical protein